MSDSQLNDPAIVEQTDPVPEAKQPALAPGAQLALHRQARGWTVEQVADQLNLASRQIQALEIDNYAALPGIVIARGFIRAYAKLLKVDSAPLVAMMPGEIVQMESLELKRALSGSFSESRLPPKSRNGLWSKWIIVSTLFVLILVAVLAAQWVGLLPGFSESVSGKIEKGVTFFSSSTSNATSAAGEGVVPDNTSTNLTNNAQVVSSPNGATVGSTDIPVQTNVTKDVIAKTIPESTAALTFAPPVANTTAPVAPVIPSNATLVNRNILVIKVREDSWVEVKGADDSILISRLLKAGSTEMLSIAQPIFLTAGNASGVDVTLRGAPVDLKTSAKNNIVRINLK